MFPSTESTHKKWFKKENDNKQRTETYEVVQIELINKKKKFIKKFVRETKRKREKEKEKLRLLVQSQAKKHWVRVPFTKKRMFALRNLYLNHMT